jgi:hypothetical protein
MTANMPMKLKTRLMMSVRPTRGSAPAMLPPPASWNDQHPDTASRSTAGTPKSRIGLSPM